MSRLLVVVDYGMGNLRSVAQAVQHAAIGSDVTVEITQSPDRIRAAERVVLPGQGAMADCMQELQVSGMQEALLEAAREKPFFGVCVGMQMLLDYSEEGQTQGLGLIQGEVKKFQLQGKNQSDGSRYKVPHMGWNQVRQAQPHALWQGVPDQSWYYFVHSYYAVPRDQAQCVGVTEYDLAFCAALAQDNLFATQFHPEKSVEQGLQLYRNFLSWKP